MKVIRLSLELICREDRCEDVIEELEQALDAIAEAHTIMDSDIVISATETPEDWPEYDDDDYDDEDDESDSEDEDEEEEEEDLE